MLCQNCGENEANVKYTQIINGVKKQMNLCDKCAKELGIDDISFNMPISFSNFLGDIFDNEIDDFIPTLIKPETLLCGKCNMSYDDFIQNGKFGCDECYNTFSTQIDSLLKNIHGVNRHIGRNGRLLGKVNKKSEIDLENKEQNKDKSKSVSDTNKNKKEKLIDQNMKKENKLMELKERLKIEIREERYEDAAKTRDEIKKMEK